MYKVEKGRYQRRVQQQEEKSENYNRNSYQRHRSKEGRYLKEFNSNGHFKDENKSLMANCSQEPADLKKTTERKNVSEISPKETEKQASRNISVNYNEHCLQNKGRKCETIHYEVRNNSSIIQNSSSCSKSDKFNDLSTVASKQNIIEHDISNEVIHACDLDNHAQVHRDTENSTEVTNSYLFNVKSNESVHPSLSERVYPSENVFFKNFCLTDLLYYNVDLMQGEQLYDYAFSLKTRVLEVIFEFNDSVRDELEFLCEITDGSQTEKNQKLITRRMYFAVANTIRELHEKSKLSNNYRNYERPMTAKTQNSDFISNTGECNAPSNQDENVEQILHNNINSCKENNENTEESNSNVNDNLTNCPRKATYVTGTNFKNNRSNVTPTQFLSNKAPLACEDTVYNSSGLENLLRYNIQEMQGSSLLSYAFALKQRILEHISEFQQVIGEKLAFLCEITDGTQTEINQKLIVGRMRLLINDSLRMYEHQNNSSKMSTWKNGVHQRET